jgi:hypothetical protein
VSRTARGRGLRRAPAAASEQNRPRMRATINAMHGDRNVAVSVLRVGSGALAKSMLDQVRCVSRQSQPKSGSERRPTRPELTLALVGLPPSRPELTLALVGLPPSRPELAPFRPDHRPPLVLQGDVNPRVASRSRFRALPLGQILGFRSRLNSPVPFHFGIKPPIGGVSSFTPHHGFCVRHRPWVPKRMHAVLGRPHRGLTVLRPRPRRPRSNSRPRPRSRLRRPHHNNRRRSRSRLRRHRRHLRLRPRSRPSRARQDCRPRPQSLPRLLCQVGRLPPRSQPARPRSRHHHR